MSKEDVEGLAVETAERIIIDYANMSGRDDTLRAPLRKSDIEHIYAALSKLTPLVAQNNLDRLEQPTPQPPTPTVKEESHTQGWNRAESEQCVRANVMHPENGSQESAVRYILEHFGVVIAAIASQEYQRGALYNHEGTFTRGFEAGRLQGIADAVAVVPKDDELLHKECVDRKKELCDVCFSKMMLNKEHKLILTALSSLTHKE